MTGITSSISIASNALLLLGSQPLSSFEEGSSQATIASNLYEGSYLSTLTNHRWRFATKIAQLARLSAAPMNGYTYAFQIPSDCIYVIKPSTTDYEVYGSLLYANEMALTLEYTYRVDESKLPPYFTKMLEFFLAAQFAIPLAGSIDKGTYYTRLYEDQLKRAKFTDSSQRPPDSIYDSPYITERY